MISVVSGCTLVVMATDGLSRHCRAAQCATPTDEAHVCTGCACPCHPEHVRASYARHTPVRDPDRIRALADAARAQARSRGRVHAA